MSAPDPAVDEDAATDAWIDAMSRIVALDVPDASRPVVREHLRIAARMAAILAQAPLDPSEEPAPVFRP